jgi:hypothetical protein
MISLFHDRYGSSKAQSCNRKIDRCMPTSGQSSAKSGLSTLAGVGIS